jgi:DNA-binding winged helix-turn-helix (wHTH) protein/tetratricopeptide (TPR) repeat protein
LGCATALPGRDDDRAKPDADEASSYSPGVRYCFGPFELDTAAGELRRDGEGVALQPKPLALLQLLIEERHRIVPIEELLDRLWVDAEVTQSSLTRAVSLARGAIGDSGRSGRIRSYTRRGYRFHGDVGEIGGEGTGAPGAGRPEFLVAGEGGVPFAGRAQALDRLRAAWEETVGGRGGIALVSGPAGIGKTRLTEVFAQEVRRRGGLALRGRALEEEGEPAFWVWAQVLRGLHDADPASLRVPGLADSGELASLMPELVTAKPGSALELPPEQRRFVFFDAVARALAQAARSHSLLVVFEDVHWADPASLRLLEHLAFELASSGVLLLATAREARPGAEHPGMRTLGVLRRQDRCAQIALGGLALEEVEALVEQAMGRSAPDLAQSLFLRTGGVPLYLREALRRILEEGGDDPDADLRLASLPLAGTDWIAEALEQLPAAAGLLLGAAAVVGREFPVPLVAAVADLDRGDALDRLDEAVKAGIVEEDPEAPVRYRFVHDLFREAAYTRLTPGTRARMHHRAAERLERQHAEQVDLVVAELAHHHHQSLAVGDPARAFACAQRAAERAFAVCAYEKATLHWGQALAALEHGEAVPALRRLSTLLALGEACRLAGERRRRREVFGEAMTLAEQLGRPLERAQAAIGLSDVTEWGVRDETGLRALEAALTQLPSDGSTPPELEARLLARMGYLDAVLHPERAEPRVRRALELARRLGSADLLEECQYALHLMLGGPEGQQERYELASEIREAAAAARDPDSAVIAILDVACDRLELGDLEGARSLRASADAMAGDPPHPRTGWYRQVYDTGFALLEGHLGEVEDRVWATRRLGRRLEHPYAEGCTRAHLALYHRERGANDELLLALEPALGAGGPREWVQAVVARAQVAVGREEEARGLFESIAGRGFDQIPRNLRWTATLVELGHACADLGERSQAGALIELLRPEEHRHGVLPMVVCYGGPASFALARLYELEGRPDDAAELYAEAREAAKSLGALPTEARIKLAWGDLELRRGSRTRARELFLQSAAAWETLRLTSFAETARARLAG